MFYDSHNKYTANILYLLVFPWKSEPLPPYNVPISQKASVLLMLIVYVTVSFSVYSWTRSQNERFDPSS